MCDGSCWWCLQRCRFSMAPPTTTATKRWRALSSSKLCLLLRPFRIPSTPSKWVRQNFVSSPNFAALAQQPGYFLFAWVVVHLIRSLLPRPPFLLLRSGKAFFGRLHHLGKSLRRHFEKLLENVRQRTWGKSFSWVRAYVQTRSDFVQRPAE